MIINRYQGCSQRGDRGRPEFCRSVNPIQTMGGKSGPSHYCHPPRFKKLSTPLTGIVRSQFKLCFKLSNSFTKRSPRLISIHKLALHKRVYYTMLYRLVCGIVVYFYSSIRVQQYAELASRLQRLTAAETPPFAASNQRRRAETLTRARR